MEIQALMRNAHMSPKKVREVARLIQGRSVTAAILAGQVQYISDSLRIFQNPASIFFIIDSIPIGEILDDL